MGIVIRFPIERTEMQRLVQNLKVQEEEIKMCLDDLEALNEHIVELTAEYEILLNRVCELNQIKLEGETND
ncbi:MAG TPA: hypothetical protein DGP89_06970 [Saprospirales bacterium]|nr:hypothetical protein [Saprospirales bacterium]